MSSYFELGNVFIRVMDPIVGGEGETMAMTLLGRPGAVEDVFGFWNRRGDALCWEPIEFQREQNGRDMADAQSLNQQFARYLITLSELEGNPFPVIL